jgi:hypothetical protein
MSIFVDYNYFDVCDVSKQLGECDDCDVCDNQSDFEFDNCSVDVRYREEEDFSENHSSLVLFRRGSRATLDSDMIAFA